jgi:hypothetical protein
VALRPRLSPGVPLSWKGNHATSRYRRCQSWDMVLDRLLDISSGARPGSAGRPGNATVNNGARRCPGRRCHARLLGDVLR